MLDGALLGWAVLWIVVGIAVGHEVRGLGEVSNTVAKVGPATTTVGETIGTLPLVGGSLDGPADEISAAARDAVESARGARQSARTLGTLLGLSIALIASLPVLVLCVPSRIAGARACACSSRRSTFVSGTGARGRRPGDRQWGAPVPGQPAEGHGRGHRPAHHSRLRARRRPWWRTTKPRPGRPPALRRSASLGLTKRWPASAAAGARRSRRGSAWPCGRR
jgi:hypothetical protein